MLDESRNFNRYVRVMESTLRMIPAPSHSYDVGGSSGDSNAVLPSKKTGGIEYSLFVYRDEFPRSNGCIVVGRSNDDSDVNASVWSRTP